MEEFVAVIVEMMSHLKSQCYQPVVNRNAQVPDDYFVSALADLGVILAVLPDKKKLLCLFRTGK